MSARLLPTCLLHVPAVSAAVGVARPASSFWFRRPSPNSLYALLADKTKGKRPLHTHKPERLRKQYKDTLKETVQDVAGKASTCSGQGTLLEQACSFLDEHKSYRYALAAPCCWPAPSHKLYTHVLRQKECSSDVVVTAIKMTGDVFMSLLLRLPCCYM